MSSAAENASSTPLGSLTRILRRFSRAVRFLSHRVRPGNDDFVESALTPSGRRKREVLDRLASSVGDCDPWRRKEPSLSPVMLRFEHTRDGRTLDVELRRKREPGVAETRCFSVGYRSQADLAADEHELLERVVDRLGIFEEEMAREADFPALLLREQASEVSYYPAQGRLELRPSLGCNHHCGFCNSVDRSITDNVLTGVGDAIERLRDLDELDELKHLPVHCITISGGEPTLLKDLPRLITEAADRGHRVELQTNGMALADPTYCRQLKNAGLNIVLISLHSADSALSDEQITLYPGGWEQTVAGIDQALKNHIRVEISHVVHAANAEGTKAFFEFVHERWERRVKIRLAFVAPTGAARQSFRQFVPDLKAIAPSLRDALKYADKARLHVVLVAYCGAPPCLLAPWDSFSEVARLGATRYPESHLQLDACWGCRYEAGCPGLWREYYEVYGDPGLRALGGGRGWELRQQ